MSDFDAEDRAEIREKLIAVTARLTRSSGIGEEEIRHFFADGYIHLIFTDADEEKSTDEGMVVVCDGYRPYRSADCRDIRSYPHEARALNDKIERVFKCMEAWLNALEDPSTGQSFNIGSGLNSPLSKDGMHLTRYPDTLENYAGHDWEKYSLGAAEMLQETNLKDLQEIARTVILPRIR